MPEDEDKEPSEMSEKTDTMENDFDVDEDAHFDEIDRMEQRMERMEMDMDVMLNEHIRLGGAATAAAGNANDDTEKMGKINEDLTNLLQNNIKVEQSNLRPLIM